MILWIRTSQSLTKGLAPYTKDVSMAVVLKHVEHGILLLCYFSGLFSLIVYQQLIV